MLEDIEEITAEAARIALGRCGTGICGSLYRAHVSAHHHGIPMYVAAPASTFDRDTATGEDIIIEQRDADELRRGPTGAIAPAEASIWNPAFDVTPASLVTAIISDRGVHRPPYAFGATPAHDDGAARIPVAR